MSPSMRELPAKLTGGATMMDRGLQHSFGVLPRIISMHCLTRWFKEGFNRLMHALLLDYSRLSIDCRCGKS